MGVGGFERKLENLVEGAFARVFRSGLHPRELGRRLTREMDALRTVDVRGRTAVPNVFTFTLSTEDHARFAEIEGSLCRELADAAREHARDEGYLFPGPVSVAIVVDPELRTGVFGLDARMKAGEGGTGAGALVLPSGERYELGGLPILIGRLPECDITIQDGNVSRRHAEIHPRGDHFVLVDLGSTNGTRVNGVRITERELRDGDELSFGNTRLVFEAS